jgi:hypothetical protein
MTAFVLADSWPPASNLSDDEADPMRSLRTCGDEQGAHGSRGADLLGFMEVLVTGGDSLGAVVRDALEDLGKRGELFGAQCG